MIGAGSVWAPIWLVAKAKHVCSLYKFAIGANCVYALSFFGIGAKRGWALIWFVVEGKHICPLHKSVIGANSV